MIKKVIASMIGTVVLFGPATVFADDAPIRVNVGEGYNRVYNYYYPKITVTSAVDMITIKDIVVNKGNCSYDKSDMAYRNGQVVAVKLLPKKLRYGENVEIRLKRYNVLRVDIDTDQGEWTYQQ